MTDGIFKGKKLLYAGGNASPLISRLWIRHCSTSSPVSTGTGDRLRASKRSRYVTSHWAHSASYSISKTRNENRPKGGDAVRLENKCETPAHFISGSTCQHDASQKRAKPEHIDKGVSLIISCDTTILFYCLIGPIIWGHSGPLCHALSLLSSLSWTSMRRRRATVATPGAAARSGEWAQHFSNASCFILNVRRAVRSR